MESWIWLMGLWREQWDLGLNGYGYGRWVLPVGCRPPGRGLSKPLIRPPIPSKVAHSCYNSSCKSKIWQQDREGSDAVEPRFRAIRGTNAVCRDGAEPVGKDAD